MEAEQIETLRIASAYESMAGSLAYKDLIHWLDTECKRTELETAQIPVSDSEKWPQHFMHWQRLVEVTQSIKNRVSAHIEAKIELEKELDNERPSNNHDFTSGDTRLLGY